MWYPLKDQCSLIIYNPAYNNSWSMYGLWGFWGARCQSQSPRTFTSTKHSPLIGRGASQLGQWATSVISTQKCPKRVDNPGGVAFI